MAPTTEAVWLALHDRLLRFVRARVADPATAEDVLQDVFVKIHARIDTLDDGDRLEAWVWQIVRNAIVDHHRRWRPAAELPEQLAALDRVDDDDPGETARQLVPCVQAAIDGLPEPYREALLLTEYGGLTQQALAERAGISLSGAKSRVQRARDRLKGVLLACCHVELDRRGGIVDYRPRGADCDEGRVGRGCGCGCRSGRDDGAAASFSGDARLSLCGDG